MGIKVQKWTIDFGRNEEPYPTTDKEELDSFFFGNDLEIVRNLQNGQTVMVALKNGARVTVKFEIVDLFERQD